MILFIPSVYKSVPHKHTAMNIAQQLCDNLAKCKEHRRPAEASKLYEFLKQRDLIKYTETNALVKLRQMVTGGQVNHTPKKPVKSGLPPEELF